MNTSDWADEVFTDGYSLFTLDSLEKQIQELKHLPDIPTSEEIKKDGINVGEMEVKILRKIEELTLYVIQLKKENEQIQLQLNSLKGGK